MENLENNTKEQLIEEVIKLRNEFLKNSSESEERFRYLSDASMEAIFFTKDGICMEANQVAAEMFAYDDPSEFVGMFATEIIAPESHEIVKEHILNNLTDPYEAVGKRKDGTLFPIAIRAKEMPFKDKVIVRVTSILDITERKQTENALRNSEVRMKALSEASFEAIFLSEKGICLDQNQTAERMFGFTRDEAVGRHGTEWIIPDDRDRVKNNMISGYEKPYEVNALRKDGTSFPCEIQARITDYQGRYIRITALRDITVRKRAEEALRESEEKFKRLFNDLGEAVFVVENGGINRGQIMEINPAAEKQTGYSRNELIGMNIAKDLAIPKSGEISHDEWDTKLLKGESITTTEKKRRKDGTQYWVEVIVTPIDYKGIKACLSLNRDITEHKKAEEALKESEEKYRDLVENIEDGIASVDENENFIYVNPAATRIFGYPEKELLNRSIKDFTKPNEYQKIIEQTSIRKTGISSKYEINIIKKDGSNAFISITSSPLFDNNKKYLGAFGMIRDITEHKKAEEALKKSEEKYRKIFDEFQDLYYKTDLKGILRDISPSVKKLTGYEREELIGKPVFEIYKNPHDRINFLKALKKTGNVEDYELTLFGKDEKEIIASATSQTLYDKNNKPIGIEGVLRDITERKQAEELLYESEEKYRAIVENSHDAIYIYKGDKFLFINDKTFELSGYNKEELYEMIIWDLIHPDDRKRIEEYGRKRFAGKETPDTYSARIIAKNGDVRDCEFAVRMIRYKNDFAILGAIHDITERKQAENDREATIELLEVLNTKTDLCGLMQNVLHLMSELSGCEAVGIRLRDGDDFPYYETKGFPDDFVEAEKHLCVDDVDGQVQRDEVGNPVLACMCGNIICGRFDPSKPFFTAHGSFVSNCTTELLANTTEEDRQARTRNRCNAEGYESVFLVPLRMGSETFGLLQFNDSRKGCFTPKFIMQIERLADNVAIAIAQRQAEKALLEREQFHRGLLDDMVSFVAVLKPDGEVIFVNNTPLKVGGLELEDVEGKKFYDCGWWTHSEEVHQTVKKYVEQCACGQALIHDIQIRTADGSLMWIEYSMHPIFDEDGSVKYLIPEGRDITKRKQADEELNRNFQQQKLLTEISYLFTNLGKFDENMKESLRLIGEYAGVSRVYVFEDFNNSEFTKNTYEWCNKNIEPQIDNLQEVPYIIIPSWKKILIEKEMVLSCNILELPQDLINILEPQKIKSIFVLPIYVKNQFFGFMGFDDCENNRIWKKTEIELLRTVTNIISTLFERKLAEENLIQALVKATESDRLKTSFLNAMSHELRTPLNAVIGFSELIDYGTEMDTILDFCNTINKSGNHLLGIIEDIFDISMIESEELKILKEKFEITKLFKDIQTTLIDEQDIENKQNIEIRFKPGENYKDIIVYSDCHRLKQILIHLLKNALKFTHEGYIEYGFSKEIINNESMLKFFVKDTGIGISKEKHKIIFDIFRQVEDSDTRKYEGVGIGLSIAKRLAEFLGGKMWLESVEGKGSTFYFTIPFTNTIVKKRNKKSTETKKANDFSGKIVLIVEDVESNYLYLEVLLKTLNIEILWVQNGSDAIQVSSENSDIDLVFMDIKMPGLINGYKTTKQIKKFYPNLPIIAQTAYALAGDKEKAIEAGCDDYISKPIKKKTLFEIIEKYLNK
jgi:PAS domain S-box-containing protein